jgi:DNA-binding NtrC family response regulator
MSATGQQRHSAVILVEEETDERKVLADLIRQAGFRVVEVQDTDAALRAIEKTPSARAIVTDAHVPGRIDGYRLAELVRRDHPRMAVILTSGHSDETSGPVPDGVSFIGKPNLLEYLVPTLRNLVA